MEGKDHLKEILGNIGQVNEPIDLEQAILKSIQTQEDAKAQITRYRANGAKALIASAILTVILGIMFSLPGSVRSLEHAMITYTSIVLILLVLFVQLEAVGTKILNSLKINLS